MATPKPKRKLDERGRDLARIHVLAGPKGLALERDLYEDIVFVHGQARSSAELDGHGRKRVIAHLEQLLRARNPKHPVLSYKGTPHNRGKHPEILKIEALLTDAGQPWAYAESILRTMTRGRKTKLAFAAPHELAAVITALDKAALKRLSAELESTFGARWIDQSAWIAATLFGFDATHRNIECYTEPMSQVVRWWRGSLSAACAWPAAADTACATLCLGCAQRAGIV